MICEKRDLSAGESCVDTTNVYVSQAFQSEEETRQATTVRLKVKDAELGGAPSAHPRANQGSIQRRIRNKNRMGDSVQSALMDVSSWLTSKRCDLV